MAGVCGSFPGVGKAKPSARGLPAEGKQGWWWATSAPSTGHNPGDGDSPRLCWARMSAMGESQLSGAPGQAAGSWRWALLLWAEMQSWPKVEWWRLGNYDKGWRSP